MDTFESKLGEYSLQNFSDGRDAIEKVDVGPTIMVNEPCESVSARSGEIDAESHETLGC